MILLLSKRRRPPHRAVGIGGRTEEFETHESQMIMRAGRRRFGEVDGNAVKNMACTGSEDRPKPNEPAQGGFVSRVPVRPGKGGVTPEHPVVFWKPSRQETHAKSLSQKTFRMVFASGFRSFKNSLLIKIKPQHHAGEFGLIRVGSQTVTKSRDGVRSINFAFSVLVEPSV